jgi:predicted SAM-dependent methyltransferase
MEWAEAARRQPLWLNLGGRRDCHPHPQYLNYVSVDAGPAAEFTIQHDLSQPVPLPAGSADRVLSEHFLEHLGVAVIASVLADCHRLLKPGGVARFATPDYEHPQERYCLKLGRDPTRRDHVTLTTARLLRELVAASPFRAGHFYQYWDGRQFVHEPIDYSLGYIRRTPENDVRNRCEGPWQRLGRWGRDVGVLARRGPLARRIDFETRKYHRLASTSVVFDLVKPPLEIGARTD